MSSPSRRWAIAAIFAIHALASLAVAMHRSRGLHVGAADVLAAALQRSQLCLLGVWLAAGREPISWRLCGLVAGGCLSFTIFSQWALPGRALLGDGASWMAEEWSHYLRLSGPGDLLLKSPWLVLGVATPLAAVCAKRWLATPAASDAVGPMHAAPRDAARGWLQFGVLDITVWVGSVCLVLSTIYHTAPYSGWWRELAEHCETAFWKPPKDQLLRARLVFTQVSALPYVLASLAAAWLVFGRGRLGPRIATLVFTAVVPAYGFQRWLDHLTWKAQQTQATTLWSHASQAWLSCLVATMMVVGSLALVRLYDDPARHDGDGGGGDRVSG